MLVPTTNGGLKIFVSAVLLQVSDPRQLLKLVDRIDRLGSPSSSRYSSDLLNKGSHSCPLNVDCVPLA
jgi:hypothetical protein